MNEIDLHTKVADLKNRIAASLSSCRPDTAIGVLLEEIEEYAEEQVEEIDAMSVTDQRRLQQCMLSIGSLASSLLAVFADD